MSEERLTGIVPFGLDQEWEEQRFWSDGTDGNIGAEFAPDGLDYMECVFAYESEESAEIARKIALSNGDPDVDGHTWSVTQQGVNDYASTRGFRAVVILQMIRGNESPIVKDWWTVR